MSYESETSQPEKNESNTTLVKIFQFRVRFSLLYHESFANETLAKPNDATYECSFAIADTDCACVCRLPENQEMWSFRTCVRSRSGVRPSVDGPCLAPPRRPSTYDLLTVLTIYDDLRTKFHRVIFTRDYYFFERCDYFLLGNCPPHFPPASRPPKRLAHLGAADIRWFFSLWLQVQQMSCQWLLWKPMLCSLSKVTYITLASKAKS